MYPHEPEQNQNLQPGSVRRIRTNLNTEPDPGSVSLVQTVLQHRAARPLTRLLYCHFLYPVLFSVFFCGFLRPVLFSVVRLLVPSCLFFSCLQLAAPSLSCYFLSSIFSRVIVSLALAYNSSPRSLHHVRLAGERPGTHRPASHQEPHTSLFPSHPVVLLRPSMHPARR